MSATIPTTTAAPVLRAPEEGELRWFGGHLFDWKLFGDQSAGALSAVETTIPAGLEPPVHVHERDDELFYVLEGELTVICGGRELRAGPGGVAFLPRGVPHGFRVETETARAFVVITPSTPRPAFEGLDEPAPARVLPERPAALDHALVEAALREWGVRVVGPPPSAPGWGAHLTA